MSWRRVPLRAIAEVALGRQRSPEHEEGENMVPYLRAGNVKDAALDLDDVKEMNFTPAEQAVFSLRPGDVLVTEGSGSLASVGAAATWSGELPGIVCFQNHLLRLRPRTDALLPEFLGYWARGCFGSGLFAAVATGANIYHLSAERVRVLPVHLPDPGVQHQIVRMLDEQLAGMAAVEAELRRIRSLLDERRWAKLTGPLEMERSRTLPLRRVLTHLTDGPFGSAFSSDDYTEGGVAVVRLGNIGFGDYRPASQAFIPWEMFERFRRHEVREGDVLIAGLGDSRNHAGRACVAPDLGPAIVKGKCFCARVDPSRADPAFIAAVLSSPVGADALAGSSRGSTRSMINLEIVKAMELPLPPVEIQRQLMRAFAVEAANEAGARSALVRQEGLLGERRRVLISRAVTGRLSMGTAA